MMRFLCAERRGRTPARSIGAAIATELIYGCHCRSANGNTAIVRQAYFRRNGVMHAPIASHLLALLSCAPAFLIQICLDTRLDGREAAASISNLLMNYLGGKG